jgi:outer membrane receptor protein involved in Fe transport
MPAAAHAAEPRTVRLQISGRPVADALVELALQTGLSLGGELDGCHGRTKSLYGRIDLQAALDRLLEGSGCRAVIEDRATVAILPAPRPAPAITVARPQPPPEPVSPDALAEIVVTSPRRAVLSGRSPYAVTAMTEADLRREGSADLQSLSPLVAGMITTNLGPGRDKIFLRGLSDGVFTGLTQSTVGLYLDEVPITYNAPDPDLRLVDIERVEVLRGPQGTLYGSGSMGGIVRIVTRRPDLDERSGSVQVGLSDTGQGGVGEFVEGAINLPVVPGRLAVRASAFQETTPGYIDDIGLGRTDINRAKRSGGRVAVKAALADGWTATVGGVHQSIFNRDTQYDFLNLPPLTRSNAVAEPHDNDFDELSLSIEGQGGWGRLTASTARLIHQLDSRYDATDALQQFLPGGSGAAAFDENRRIRLWVSEVSFASPRENRLHWLAGGFASIGDTAADDTVGLVAPAAPPPPLYTERRMDDVDELAVFGEATWDLTPKLGVTLGGRWFRFRFHTRSHVMQGLSRDFSGKGDASGFSPKLLFSYQAARHALVYLQASEGHRVGGFNTSGPIGQSFDGGIGQPTRSYDPDTLWNYEAGVKAQLIHNKLQLRAAVFLADWRDIQTDQFLASGLPFTLNVGDGRNRGIELEATWRVRNSIDIRLAGLLDDPELTRLNPAFASRADAGLPGVPDVSGGVGATWRKPLTDRLSLRLDASASYVGPSTLTFDAQRVFRMGDYVSAKASASLARGRWRLTAAVDNPTDSRANTFAFGNPFRIGKVQQANPLRPRTFSLRLGADF